jgi:hypothetical protein
LASAAAGILYYLKKIGPSKIPTPKFGEGLVCAKKTTDFIPSLYGKISNLYPGVV